MPNWCDNHLVLRHKDAREIGRAKMAILNNNFFQELHPCPEELLGTNEQRTRANLDKYGYTSWYDWRLSNWGTKWDASEAEIVSERYEGDIAELTVGFDTAWVPPIEFYNELVEQGFEVSAMYNEFGVGFCGEYYNGADQRFDYNESTVDNIPYVIDERFGISESFAEWADEE